MYTYIFSTYNGGKHLLDSECYQCTEQFSLSVLSLIFGERSNRVLYEERFIVTNLGDKLFFYFQSI